MIILQIQENYKNIPQSGGIYLIQNKLNDRRYFGKTCNFQQRLLHHYKALRDNKHVNQYLQKDWTEMGAEGFEFYILEVIDTEPERCARELELIQSNENLYNIATKNSPSFPRRGTFEPKNKIPWEVYEKNKGNSRYLKDVARYGEELVELMKP
jgi:group I intron endonuclease